jgi:hypothetical protein
MNAEIKNYFVVMMADERLGDKIVSIQDSPPPKKMMPYHYFVVREGININNKIYLIESKHAKELNANKFV